MDNINLNLPKDLEQNVQYILDSTPKDRIFITSDWHINAHKYGKGRNHINVSKMLSWCKNHIKDNDVFLYLGDMCFRYANEEDSEDAQEKFKSIPGKKILILGNHDRMQGEEFYTNCGFDFIYEELIYHNILFTHRPVNIDKYPHIDINIHGHIHDETFYYTTDGKDNINVYGNKPFTLEYLLNHKDKFTKYNYWKTNYGFGESAFEETKRSNLPDSLFGIPEDRKFPLDTAQHVNSAIKLFGHAEESKKKSLAKRINAAAKRYNIVIKDTSQVAKYLKEDVDDTIKEEIDDEDKMLDKVIDNANDTILISTPSGLNTVNIADIPHWYVDNKRSPLNLTEDMFCNSLADAICEYCPTEEYDKKDGLIKDTLYVFICNAHRQDIDTPWEPICVGIISIDIDGNYEWEIQYPVKCVDGIYSQVYKHEAMSMAAMNPVKGISKPIITKILPTDEKYTNTLYAFSPDIISDKYLVINENANLDVVDYDTIKEYYVLAQYEFTGDIRNFNKVFNAYRENKIVDNTFFYTALTGKPLLTEDQIDFDKDFKKIDHQGIRLAILSELATNKYNHYASLQECSVDVPMGNSDESYLYNKYKDFKLSTKYSINGYYVESSVLNRRSSFVNTHKEVNKSLIMSVLNNLHKEDLIYGNN